MDGGLVLLLPCRTFISHTAENASLTQQYHCCISMFRGWNPLDALWCIWWSGSRKGVEFDGAHRGGGLQAVCDSMAESALV